MRVIDPGHVYELAYLDTNPENPASGQLSFVKREGPGYSGNRGHHAGTNLQEVLRAMIERVKYLDRQVPHVNNIGILVNLRHSLWLLELRAAERHGRAFDLSWGEGIEDHPTCPLCGHIGCKGDCKSHEPKDTGFTPCWDEHASGHICQRRKGHDGSHRGSGLTW